MRLSLYIFRQVIHFVCLVMLAIMSLQFFVLMVNELSDIGKGQYTFGLATLYCLLQLPSRIYDFLPVILFMGGLLAFGDLGNHNELIVMRASGYSNARFLRNLIFIAITLGFSLTLCFEYCAPRAERYANTAKELSVTSGKLLQRGKSIWLKEKTNFIHIKEVMHPGLFAEVTLYEISPDHTLKSAASAAWLKQDDDGWVAHDYKRTDFKGNHTEVYQAHEERLPLLLTHSWFTHARALERAGEMSLPAIIKKIRILKRNQMNVSQLSVELWQRMSRPLAGIVMLFLSIPFVLGSVRHVGIGLRLSLGLLIGFLYYFLNKLLLVLGVVYELDPKLISLIPIVCFILLGTWIWRRGAF